MINIIHTETLLTKLHDNGVDTTITVRDDASILLELYDMQNKAILGVISGPTVEEALVNILIKFATSSRHIGLSNDDFSMLSRL